VLESVKDLRGCRILATDGAVGALIEFYFDDASWQVRYLVVDTGNWLSGRRVLISPSSIRSLDPRAHTVTVALTQDQIRYGPDIDTDKPVSRQHEAELAKYYGWPAYWAHSAFIPGVLVPAPPAVPSRTELTESLSAESGDPHLRSTNEVIGYHLAARDGEFGHVEDFILDDSTWHIRYMVVDTRNWLPGKRVLVTPQWIESIVWKERKVHLDLLQEAIRKSPEFDVKLPVSREYEERLLDYYGRPKYWVRKEGSEDQDSS